MATAPVLKPDPAHEAWRRYYHYLRLERHGQPLTWHGGKGWARAFGVGAVLLGIVAYGFHHRASPYAYSPSDFTFAAPGTVPSPQPALPSEPIKPPRP